jgi:hypothetical protein
MTVTPQMPTEIRAMLRAIALALPAASGKVDVVQGDYRDAPDVEATWFVDPPYQGDGRDEERAGARLRARLHLEGRRLRRARPRGGLFNELTKSY